VSTEKGNFSADISQSVIEEALSSVRRHSAESDATHEARELDELKAQLELSQAKGRELMEKLKEEHDRTLRALADLENSKKRVQKEKEELSRFGQEKLLKDFLPVADNLDRALEHAAQGSDPAGLQKGIEMVRKLLEDALARHGVKSFSALGQPFDPRLHEAMNQVETNDLPANSVVTEMVRGYTLHDRLFRPALVTVAKPRGSTLPTSAPESSTGEGI
jgi:molecular chaperone GrpE